MNDVRILGLTSGDLKVNHTLIGRDNSRFVAYETDIEFISKNNIRNLIKVIFFEDNKYAKILSKKGDMVQLFGEIHSFNKDAYGKRICEVFVNPTKVLKTLNAGLFVNKVSLIGKICGSVHTKCRCNGNLVSEAKVKVKREGERSRYDYIPIVAFSETAKALSKCQDGEQVEIEGRIHSRCFPFRCRIDGCNSIVDRTAYEVGIHKLVSRGQVLVDKEIRKLIQPSISNRSLRS